MNPKHTVKILLAAALGVMAILVLPGLASAKDRNHDHIPDRWEKRHHLSLTVNQARRDQDGDHLGNLAEFKAGDNPRNSDSNGDGVMDGEENAGTIASFDVASGKLVISLFGGESISGLVTEQTEIKCEGAEGGSASASSDEAEAGDDNGGGSSGSDNSSSGDQGDDGEGEGANCTSADLTEGTVVQQADLEIANGAATFHEVELAPIR